MALFRSTGQEFSDGAKQSFRKRKLNRRLKLACCEVKSTQDTKTPEPTGSCAPEEERRLAKDPEWIRAYNAEIQKLVQACSVLKLEPSALANDRKSWYIPHYMVTHNGKNHIAFNCSYHFRGLNLNESPMPGPSRGPSLLGSAAMFQRASRCNQQRHRRDVSSGPPPSYSKTSPCYGLCGVT